MPVPHAAPRILDFPGFTPHGRRVARLGSVLFDDENFLSDPSVMASVANLASGKWTLDRQSRVIKAMRDLFKSRAAESEPSPTHATFNRLISNAAMARRKDAVEEICGVILSLAVTDQSGTGRNATQTALVTALDDETKTSILDGIMDRFDSEPIERLADWLHTHAELSMATRTAIVDIARGGSRNHHEIAAVYDNIASVFAQTDPDGSFTELVERLRETQGTVTPFQSLRDLSGYMIVCDPEMREQFTPEQILNIETIGAAFPVSGEEALVPSL